MPCMCVCVCACVLVAVSIVYCVQVHTQVERRRENSTKKALRVQQITLTYKKLYPEVYILSVGLFVCFFTSQLTSNNNCERSEPVTRVGWRNVLVYIIYIYIYLYPSAVHLVPHGPPVNAQRANVGPAG